MLFNNASLFFVRRLSELGLIDSIVEEPMGGAHRNYSLAFDNLKTAITNSLNSLKMLNTEELVSKRQEKIRGFGKFKEAT